ncbi:CDP-glycerol--glycerophosphate glycerophosphotransferase [Sporolactobacillus shoreae]|uniref:CDP-glycerol--glycerophosphate glycerophosphotransferase n=1 Tax=Sporolactobacillus shoreae TaxID=1465501 RepID=A0A4Z0GUX7_9BACL|nr:CDP-glycerol--glycerophosphate glycerophosphotransferase [Sporolactobacillus shoreae]
MIREWLVSAYLYLFKILFVLAKLFPQKEKVSFVVSFSENTKYLAHEFEKEQLKTELVFLCRGKCIADFSGGKGTVIPFETSGFLDMARSAYHLATSKTVFVDNYFGFLSVVKFRKEVQCIQIWHAAGALKTFGLEDKSISMRTRGANRRFAQVYQRFDKVIVGSDIMAEIFKRSFGITDDRILRTGIPRTDFFYHLKAEDPVFHDMTAMSQSGSDEQYGLASEVQTFIDGPFASKRKILYAPTYRDNERNTNQLHLDIDQMKNELGAEYVLLLRLHPAVRDGFVIPDQDQGFAFDCSSYSDINQLLLISDILVTDYSSIPVEYSLLNKPMIFFPYDLKEYGRERGFQADYMDWVPGPVAFSTTDLIKLIRHNSFDMKQVAAFSSQWNRYSKGFSSRNVVQYVIKSCGLR